MKYWFTPNDLVMLGHVKCSHMFIFFEEIILPHISPYFQPLVPFIRNFWSLLHPQRTDKVVPVGSSSCHSTATGRDIVEVFKLALLDKELIKQAGQSDSTLGKRALPGDLASSQNGWDTAKVSKTAENGKRRKHY